MRAKGDQRRLAAFGLAVLTLRKERGLTQERLAHAARLDRSYIGQIETGRRNPSLLNVCALAEALDVRVAELLKDVA